MSAAARDELLARLSFLAHLFPEKRILCVGAPEAHAEDLGNALAEHGAAEVTVSHVRAEDGTMASVSVWTDLTDVADGGIDVVIVNGAEILCDEPWYDELRRCLAPGARLIVIADNPDVMGAGQGYDDIVASVSPHFPSIELVTETRMSAQILTPYGADPEAMSLDASLASPQDARTWIFVCGEDSAALTAETVALLDEGSSVEAFAVEHEERERIESERAALEEKVGALEASLADAGAASEAEAQARTLADEALKNAEQRMEELQARVERAEADRETTNGLQRHLDEAIAREEDARRMLGEVEGARRGEHDARIRAERFASDLEARHAVMKGELAQRETRVKRLVEEVQRLEGELQSSRDESETRISQLVRERDDRRDLMARLSRDNEGLRSETQRLQALLTRARDDLQLLHEQQGQARAHAVEQREALERETTRAKDANDALIAASSTLNLRERTIAELKAQIALVEGEKAQQRHENEELEARLTHAQQTGAAHRSARERSEAALKGASHELHRVQGELTITTEKLAVVEKRVQHAETRLREAEARAHETAAEYRVLLTAADAELTGARAQIERANTEAADARAAKEHALAERAVAIERAETEHKALVAEQARLKAAEGDLKSALERAESRVAILSAEQAAAKNVEAELRAQLARLATVEQDLASKESELRTVTKQKTETEAALAKLADGKTKLQAELSRVEADLVRASKEAKDGRDKVKALELLLGEADLKASEAQKRLDEESRRGAIANGATNELERKRVAAMNDAELQRQRAEEMAQSAAEAERERDRLTAEMKTVSAREEGLLREVKQERDRTAEMQRVLDAERAQVTELRRELAAAKAAVQTKAEPAAAGARPPQEKSQEWQVLDTFSEDVLVDQEWSAGGREETEKTRVVK